MAYIFQKQICAICGMDDAVFLGVRVPRGYEIPEELQARIVQCRGCGLIYPDPMPYPDAEQLSTNYGSADDYFPTPISPERMAWYELILDRLESITSRRGMLLDIGCGRGELLSVAKSRGWEVTGNDVSAHFAELAEKRFAVKVIRGDIARLTLDASSYDAVSLISVLHNIHDPKRLLTSIHKLLRKGGVLFIETMNSEGLLYRMGDLYYHATGRGVTTHLSPTFPHFQIFGFSRACLRDALESSGFTIVEMTVEGTISKKQDLPSSGLWEQALRFCWRLTMRAGVYLNQGPVLVALAKKS